MGEVDITRITPRVLVASQFLPWSTQSHLKKKNTLLSMTPPALHTPPRTSLPSLYTFLKARYQQRWMLVHLADTLHDDITLFQHRLIQCPLRTVSIKTLFDISRAIQAWLDFHPENVVVIVCNNGRSRSSLVVSCFLEYSEVFPSSTDAFEYFLHCRSPTETGWVTPTHRRYVQYFHAICQYQGHVKQKQALVICRIILNTVPLYPLLGHTKQQPKLGCRPGLEIYNQGQLVYYGGQTGQDQGKSGVGLSSSSSSSTVSSSQDDDVFMDDYNIVFHFHHPHEPVILHRDVVLRIFHREVTPTGTQNRTIVHFAFNTGFMEPGLHRIHPMDLEIVCPHLHPDFSMDLLLAPASTLHPLTYASLVEKNKQKQWSQLSQFHFVQPHDTLVRVLEKQGHPKLLAKLALQCCFNDLHKATETLLTEWAHVWAPAQFVAYSPKLLPSLTPATTTTTTTTQEDVVEKTSPLASVPSSDSVDPKKKKKNTHKPLPSPNFAAVSSSSTASESSELPLPLPPFSSSRASSPSPLATTTTTPATSTSASRSSTPPSLSSHPFPSPLSLPSTMENPPPPLPLASLSSSWTPLPSAFTPSPIVPAPTPTPTPTPHSHPWTPSSHPTLATSLSPYAPPKETHGSSALTSVSLDPAPPSSTFHTDMVPESSFHRLEDPGKSPISPSYPVDDTSLRSSTSSSSSPTSPLPTRTTSLPLPLPKPLPPVLGPPPSNDTPSNALPPPPPPPPPPFPPSLGGIPPPPPPPPPLPPSLGGIPPPPPPPPPPPMMGTGGGNASLRPTSAPVILDTRPRFRSRLHWRELDTTVSTQDTIWKEPESEEEEVHRGTSMVAFDIEKFETLFCEPPAGGKGGGGTGPSSSAALRFKQGKGSGAGGQRGVQGMGTGGVGGGSSPGSRRGMSMVLPSSGQFLDDNGDPGERNPGDLSFSFSSSSSSLPPKEVVYHLDVRRVNNIDIALTALFGRRGGAGASFEFLVNALMDLNTDQVDPETMRMVSELMPTEDETNVLSRLTPDPNVELPRPEAFLKLFIDLPHRAFYFKAWMMHATFHADVQLLKDQFTKVSQQCVSIRQHGGLKILLRAILNLGNLATYEYGRGGGMSGSLVMKKKATGFKLEALTKLKDVKSGDGQWTLLYYLVDTLANGMADILDVPKAFLDLASLKQLQLKDLVDQLNVAKKDIQVLQTYLDLDLSSTFLATFIPSFQRCQTLVLATQAAYDDVRLQFEKTVLYFGESLDTFTAPEQLFSVLDIFFLSFKQTVEQHARRTAAVMKQKNLTSSPSPSSRSNPHRSSTPPTSSPHFTQPSPNEHENNASLFSSTPSSSSSSTFHLKKRRESIGGGGGGGGMVASRSAHSLMAARFQRMALLHEEDEDDDEDEEDEEDEDEEEEDDDDEEEGGAIEHGQGMKSLDRNELHPPSSISFHPRLPSHEPTHMEDDTSRSVHPPPTSSIGSPTTSLRSTSSRGGKPKSKKKKSSPSTSKTLTPIRRAESMVVLHDKDYLIAKAKESILEVCPRCQGAINECDCDESR